MTQTKPEDQLKPNSSSIFAKLFASFMGVSLVLILAAVALFYQFSLRLTEANLHSEFLDLQDHQVALFERAHLSPLKNTLSMLSISASIEKLGQVSANEKLLVRFAIEREFQQIIRLSGNNYLSVRYIDANGNEQVVVEGNRRVRDYRSLVSSSDRAGRFFRRLRDAETGDIQFCKPWRDSNEQLRFFAGIALSEPDVGGFGGIVLIETHLNEFANHINQLRFREHTVASLLLKHERSSTQDDDIHYVPIVLDDNIKPSILIRFEMPKAVLQNQVNAIAITALVALLLSLGAVLIVATMQARAISAPLRDLVAASRRVAQGVFEPIRFDSRYSELSELADSFNVMIEELRSSLQQLQADIQRRRAIEQDLSDHKNNLERLVEARTLEFRDLNYMFQLVLDTIPIRVFWKDTNLLYLGCNKYFANDAGFTSSEQLVGKSDYDMGWRDQADLYRADDRRVIESGEAQLYYEEPQTTPDGDTIWLRTSKIPLRDSSGQIIGVLGSYENITQRKQVELELENTRIEALRASEAKSMFLANMSHEIRTPMNAILGMMHLAIQSGLDPSQADYIRKAQYSAESLLRIINDILDFSKIEAGKLVLENKNFEVMAVIDNVINLTRLKAEEKGISIDIDVEQAIPDYLNGDPVRLGQILINLTSNAVKFSRDGGHVSIRVRLLEADADRVVLEFSITDQGIGMSEEQLDRLFQSFSQADASTSRQYGGTGLGLAISRQLTQMMGGDIHVQSEESVGSTFYFNVALKPADSNYVDAEMDARNDKTLQQAITRLAGARVLLVEDNDLNQELVRELLRYENIEVDSAENGQQALEALSQARYDLVLMDCQIPVMDGYEATRRIRMQPALQDLPVVALTANVMQEDISRALASGMNDHIGKPVDPYSMFITMAKWLKEHHD